MPNIQLNAIGVQLVLQRMNEHRYHSFVVDVRAFRVISANAKKRRKTIEAENEEEEKRIKA